VTPVVGMKRDIKDDKCKRSRYEGDNITDQEKIFSFERRY
jgi:hypothetical protein